MQEFGKILVLFGIIFITIGALLILLPKLNLPLGNLPGDIKVEREHFKFYFPLGTSIVLSLILTLILNLLLVFLSKR